MDSEKKLSKTMAYYASYIAIGFTTGIIGPTLPGLAEHTGTALSGISFLFLTHSTGYLVGSFLSGHLLDRVKGHPVISSALFLLMVVMVLIPLTHVIWLLMGLFFITGMAAGGIDVGGNTLLIWVHKSSVGPFMVGLHFFYGLGAFLAPMAVGQTMKFSGDIVWAYWILACICCPLSVLFLRLRSPEHTRRPAAEGSEEENRLMVFFISIFMFLHVGAEVSYGGWISSYAHSYNYYIRRREYGHFRPRDELVCYWNWWGIHVLPMADRSAL
jgi:FHS family Na+ dependent glucose MFS transporter 1